ncbi:MAG: hypothetical protein OXE99_03810 [Cellvibrionales bacterium]|nr:hypothetical protein [Cellvibrionales bacterium]
MLIAFTHCQFSSSMGIYEYSIHSKQSIGEFIEGRSIKELYGCPFLFIVQCVLGTYQGSQGGIDKVLIDYQIDQEVLFEALVKASDSDSDEKKLDLAIDIARKVYSGKWREGWQQR